MGHSLKVFLDHSVSLASPRQLSETLAEIEKLKNGTWDVG